MSQDTLPEQPAMPNRKPYPRKRKLPPGVVGMAEWKEAKRLEQVERNRQAFMRLPPEERRRQLMDMLGVRIEIPGVPVAEKKPGEE